LLKTQYFSGWLCFRHQRQPALVGPSDAASLHPSNALKRVGCHTFYLMMEAELASETLCFKQRKNWTMENVQYMCQFNKTTSSKYFRLILQILIFMKHTQTIYTVDCAVLL
jgi:hypothetical protein